MYCDDQGIAKKLPLNRRATELTIACGRPMQVLGDIFISRFIDDDKSTYRRLDFSHTELLEPEWKARCSQSNAAGKDPKDEETTKSLKKLLQKQATASLRDSSNSCQNHPCPNAGTQRCGACRVALYCSKECQRESWKSHKLQCKTVK